ncbi:hypothetical protein [Novosphingobium sp.]|uniref:hypothetical protein n=1 Tax=Novosphingobium sp. TaxID=1874826 RepID=UPI0035AE51FD
MMGLHFNPRRLAAAALAVVLSAALAACFVLPGKFVSSLDLRKDGRFTYTYKGEIFLLGLSQLSKMGDTGAKEFTPSACYNDDADMTERECTKEELDQQRSDWAESEKQNAAQRKKEAEEMSAMFGGIDPSDPKAGEEIAARLRRQAGWKAVTYKGDGLYEVDFAISGHLDYDFVFPTMERIQPTLPFVMLNKRNDGTVRFDSPGFEGAGTSGMLGPMAGMGSGGMSADEKAAMDSLPMVDGTFTLTTDGQIMANNTDEGPVAVPGGQKLEWKIDPRSKDSPTALIKLGN